MPFCFERNRRVNKDFCDPLDEITHAFSLALDPSGEKFIAGLKNQEHIFSAITFFCILYLVKLTFFFFCSIVKKNQVSVEFH